MKEDPKKLPPPPEHPAQDPYSAHDPIPVPEVVESDSDAAWEMWEAEEAKEKKQEERGFAPTVPAELQPLTPSKAPKRRP